MAEQVNWTVAVRVLGGPTLAAAGEMIVDAYTKVTVTIPQGATQDVEVFPGAGGSAQIVVISPATPSADLTYKVGTKDIPLDGPHVLIGGGAVGMLAGSSGNVGTLKVTNGTGADADLSVIAARDATP